MNIMKKLTNNNIYLKITIIIIFEHNKIFVILKKVNFLTRNLLKDKILNCKIKIK